MTQKGKSPEKTDVTPSDLRRIAELIRRYSSHYEGVANEMEEAGLDSIPATGFTALENNALKLIRGHANKLKSTVQSYADAKVLASLNGVEERDLPEAHANTRKADKVQPPSKAKAKRKPKKSS